MSITQKNLLQVLAVSALALGLTACGPNDGQTTGQKLDNAVDRTEQAAEKAKSEVEKAAETTGQKLENAMDATKDAASNATAAMGEAGVTAKVKAALVGDSELSALKIEVDTNGGAVTLSGEAPNQAAKDRAEQLAKGVEGVTSVNNLLTVKS